MTEQEQCLEEYRQAEERRQLAAADAMVQFGLAGIHAQENIPPQPGGAA